MRNKKQLHLKTINFDEANTTYSRLTCNSFLKPKRGSTQIKTQLAIADKKQIKPHPKSKRYSAQMHPSAANEEIINRFHELQINRRSLRIFTNNSKCQFFRQTGEFPKRQPILKNTNAFKYFLNSTINKMPTADVNYLDDFYKKIAYAMAEQASKSTLIIQKPQRSTTECSAVDKKTSRTKRPLRPKSTSAHQLKRKIKTNQMCPDPWQTPNAQENILFLTDF